MVKNSSVRYLFILFLFVFNKHWRGIFLIYSWKKNSSPKHTAQSKWVVKDMDRITEKEIKQLTEDCLQKIKSDDLYRIRNDAKLRAVNNTKTYDEFKWDFD